MKLTLKNIGKINSADIDISGITVIAGENNTGKSTIGKALYSSFNGMSELSKKIVSDRIDTVSNVLRNILRENDRFIYGSRDNVTEDYAKKILEVYHNEDKDSKEEVTKILIELLERKEFLLFESSSENIDENNKRSIYNGVELIFERLGIDDISIQNQILLNSFQKEFGKQVETIDLEERAYVSLEINSNIRKITFEKNRVIGDTRFSDLRLNSVYIDNPFVLDDTSIFWGNNRNHQSDLKNLLFSSEKINASEEILLDEKFRQISHIFNNVNVGNLVNSNKRFIYQEDEREYSLNNVSLGLKTFIILKTLIEKGMIQEKGTIILDEPEIHLHPQWQIDFAELIVLLQKVFNLHVLLTTHSPYFLEAIEVFSQKYNVEDKCNYYLNENIKGEISVKRVNGKLQEVYKKFFTPFKELTSIKEKMDDEREF